MNSLQSIALSGKSTRGIVVVATSIAMAMAVSLTGCKDSRDSSAAEAALAEASHQRMVNELKGVKEDVYHETYWFGTDRLKQQRLAVVNLPPDTSPNDLFDAHFELGTSETRLGVLEVGIAELEKSVSIYPLTSFPLRSLDSCRYNLGLAYLRLGENENCCRLPSPESCRFPIRGEGLHKQTEGARKALTEFLAVARSPDAHPIEKANASWLAAIAAMTINQYPEILPTDLRLSALGHPKVSSPFPRFVDIAPQLGVNRFGLAGSVVVDDFNGDGHDDLVGSVWDPAVDLFSFDGTEGGGFVASEDQSDFSGIAGGLNISHADFDNDGDLDFLVLRGGWMAELGTQPNSLMRNDGDGKFVDVAFASGIAVPSYPTQTAEWADFDLDGDLDLFVGNEGRTIKAPCQLFRNDGVGEDGMVKFVDIARTAGVEVNRYVKGVSWGDFNNDRYPDLYVSCFSAQNHLYQNRGDGTFVEVAGMVGVGEPAASFPTWFWDYNNDGNLDIFVSGFRYLNDVFLRYYQGKSLPSSHSARLYRGNGAGGFEDVTLPAGLDLPMMTMGSNFADIDNDGFPDMYLGTGSPEPSAVVPNLLLVNRGGENFVDVTVASGMGHLQKGHGVCFADFDRDGDLDVFEQMGGAFASDSFFDAVYENPGFGNHWLEVRLKGVTSNSYGIGCRIRAVLDNEKGGERSVYTWLNSGGSFGSNPLVAHLGLAGAGQVKRLEVFWPVTGITQSFADVPADQRIVVTEGKKKWQAQ